MGNCTCNKNYYWCIFRVPIGGTAKTSMTTEIAGVLTMSGCGCHGHCKPHKGSSEGMSGILANSNDYFPSSTYPACTGHRLLNENSSDTYPKVNTKQTANANTFNALRNLIDAELTARKVSPLYTAATKGNIPETVDTSDIILRSAVLQLNNIIQNNSFYKDTIIVPTQTDLPTITATTASSEAINKLSDAVKKLRADCICYSDCNSYYMCTCYGYCKHY